jgi:hypothetical protein
MTGYCGPMFEKAANQIGVEKVGTGKSRRGFFS